MLTHTAPVAPAAPPVQPLPSAREDTLREAARELETTFLAEMLKSAGFGKSRESFGGGAGEEQFSSFLRQEQARAMVDAGGIGLSEAFFNALKERANV
ncbi:rod-binding protein [Shimia sp. R11_0]|uniref:Chemotactic signal-response protein CheL n=1 Tax=Shimia marina TaxID=321267 RepID=A0A0P1ELP3_9RHOB|nr:MULTISPECIES: rod-binding protein [Shimia]MBO9476266.1 rod-binding protein [Shimia sp. R11_0]CUH51373.1 chemotactic signal-response protein CheL [Shimia marina]SFD50746.1 Rod binding protein [Shimia marina]